jgi:hypothetical protein
MLIQNLFRNQELYAKYQKLAAAEPGVTFIGKDITPCGERLCIFYICYISESEPKDAEDRIWIRIQSYI